MPPPSASSSQRLGDEEFHVTRQIARRHLLGLRNAQPGWTVGTLVQELGFQDTPWLRKMAAEAGFSEGVDGDANAQAILALYQGGVWSPEIIAEETNSTAEHVRGVLARMPGYGNGVFGSTPYGGHSRRISTDETPALRRVSVVGQMSYRKHTYSLGCSYRGRIAFITETERELIVAFGDRPSLRLMARHGRPV